MHALWPAPSLPPRSPQPSWVHCCDSAGPEAALSVPARPGQRHPAATSSIGGDGGAAFLRRPVFRRSDHDAGTATRTPAVLTARIAHSSPAAQRRRGGRARVNAPNLCCGAQEGPATSRLCRQRQAARGWRLRHHPPSRLRQRLLHKGCRRGAKVERERQPGAYSRSSALASLQLGREGDGGRLRRLGIGRGEGGGGREATVAGALKSLPTVPSPRRLSGGGSPAIRRAAPMWGPPVGSANDRRCQACGLRRTSD